jgi:opacity protein-like surface antigen
MQGVAGIAYELMPGVGAGLEYRYQGFNASTPVARGAADNQTIMMRLDLGLN